MDLAPTAAPSGTIRSVKTASTIRRPTLKNRTRARARCSGVNTRRACIETTANRTSKPTCIYESRRRLESCSRDPIGYVDGYSLYVNYFGQTFTDPTGRACTPIGPIGPVTTTGYAASGGLGISVSTNPSVVGFVPATSIVCTATHTQTFSYTCSCREWLPWPCLVKSAMTVTVSEDESFTLPGNFELVYNVTAPLPGGIPGGPGPGLDFAFLRPGDVAAANTRCTKAAAGRVPAVTPTASVACP